MLEKIIFILSCLILTFFLIFYSLPFLFGAPYDNSRKKQIKTIIEFSKKPKYIAELGSGSGKIAIELAKENKKIDCYEINPFLVIYSRHKIKKLGYQNKIKVIWGNFFDYNLSKYDAIVMFQFSTIMKKLKNKFEKELKSKTLIISNHWKLPKINPLKSKNDVFVYSIKSKIPKVKK